MMIHMYHIISYDGWRMTDDWRWYVCYAMKIMQNMT